MSPTDPLLLLAAAPARGDLVAALQRLRALPLDRLVETLSAGPAPRPGDERLAIVAPATGLHAALDFAIARLPAHTRSRLVARAHGLSFTRNERPRGRVAFLFPGQGSEHTGMLRSLRRRAPVVRGWFDAIDAAAVEAGDAPVTDALDADTSTVASPLRRAVTGRESSVMLGTVADLSVHALLADLGVDADVYLGHSYGEHAALIAAGRVANSRTDLCRGFIRLGKLTEQTIRPGLERLIALSAVDLGRIDERLNRETGRLFFAMDNCPNQIVIGGEAEAADRLASDAASWGGIALTLPFAHAYHTPLFAPVAAQFAAYYEEWQMQSARVPVYSCLTERELPADATACRREMAAQLTSTVRFRTTIEHLYASGVTTFVEVGPDNKLTAFVEDTLRNKPHVATSTTTPNRDDVHQILHLMADLFVAGHDVEPSRLARALGRTDAVPTALPGAAAIHERLIADARARLERVRSQMAPALAARPTVRQPLLGDVSAPTGTQVTARRVFTRSDDAFVLDHALGRVHGDSSRGGYPLPVLPFTLSLEMAAEAGRAAGLVVRGIRDVRASRWLALDFGALTVLMDGVRRTDACTVTLSAVEDDAKHSAFEAEVTSQPGTAVTIVADEAARPPARWTAARFYADYAFHGPAFQGIKHVVTCGPNGVSAELAVTSIPGVSPESLVLDPAMLDCAGQLVAFWLLEQHGMSTTFGVFPFAVKQVRIHRAPLEVGATLRCRAHVSLSGLHTEGAFCFETLAGEPIVSVDGFRQRIMHFPEWFSRRVFGGERVSLPLTLSDDDRELLAASWGIWERALAHLTLAPDKLAHWRRLPASHRPDWLMAHADV